MNDGINGFGHGYFGVKTPAIWQIYESSTNNIPFVAEAKYLSIIAMTGGGGGGGGRFDTSATNSAACGGAGGAGSAVVFVRRVPLAPYYAQGLFKMSITIGAGGTAGAGTNVNLGTPGGGGAAGNTSLSFFFSNAGRQTGAYFYIAGNNGGQAGQSTGLASGGFASGTTPYGQLKGCTGGGGGSYPSLGFGQSVFADNMGCGGGTGGNNKNSYQFLPPTHIGIFGQPNNVGNAAIGENGFDAEILVRALHDELMKLPYCPDLMELRSYLAVGGGGGAGGSTAGGEAGGRGGNGFRGSGGGGGGGCHATASGAGGVGGNGCVFFCWEF